MQQYPKKSDSIEIRLPHQAKRAFMEQCRAEGRTASEVVRGFVEMKIADAPVVQTRRDTGRLVRRLAALVLAGALALGAPATVSATPDFQPWFAAFDRNRNGVLTPEELGVLPVQTPPCNEEHRAMVLPLRQAGMAGTRGMRPFALSTADFDFKAADADRDGNINFAEFAANQLRILHAGFEALDRDHDGNLRIREYVAAYAIEFRGREPNIAPFQELDRNGDGNVAWDEFLR